MDETAEPAVACSQNAFGCYHRWAAAGRQEERTCPNPRVRRELTGARCEVLHRITGVALREMQTLGAVRARNVRRNAQTTTTSTSSAVTTTAHLSSWLHQLNRKAH
jgi:hypothetical protein